MDWIDPRYETATEDSAFEGDDKPKRKSKKMPRETKKGTPLAFQVSAALSQPLDVWTVAFDHAISRLRWPNGCSVESTFLWSSVMQEQAEVLVRAGLSAKKLSAIISEKTATTDEEKAAELSQVVGLMDQSLESLAFRWLDSADAYAHSALGIAALAWHIPDQAGRPGNEWLTNWLQAIMDRIACYQPRADEPVLCHLVLQCELPLLIGVATSASKRAVLAEASKAMDFLAEYLEQSEDNSGPWLMHGATYLRAALASVLRCRVAANSLGLRKWYPAQQKALVGLLKHAARWSRPDGTQLLAAGHASPRSKSIWEALVKQTKNPTSLATSMTLRGIGSGKRAEVRKKCKVATLPALTHYNENAAGVCMQSDWRTKSSHVALDFSDAEICLEALGPKGRPVLVGEWTAEVEFNGQPQLRLDEWSATCWFSDEEVDYIELEAKFGQDARIQRQMMLFREERLLLFADALLCDTTGAWSMKSSLPLPADATFSAEPKTMEGFIVGATGFRVLAMPLFLPEWRRQCSMAATPGNLSQQADNLVASMSCTNSNRLYMPTLISLCNSHAKKPFTWRQLTVAEDLRIVGPHEAAAYRVQIGTEQWIIYRTLDGAKKRTALGMHTFADFYAGRFDSEDGSVDTIVEVEVTTAATLE